LVGITIPLHMMSLLHVTVVVRRNGIVSASYDICFETGDFFFHAACCKS
jgi:hypothetical protein